MIVLVMEDFFFQKHSSPLSKLTQEKWIPTFCEQFFNNMHFQKPCRHENKENCPKLFL